MIHNLTILSGTNQITGEDGGAGNPSARNQGVESGLGRSQQSDSFGDAAPESGLGKQQTDFGNQDSGVQAGLGKEQQEGGLGDFAPESGMGKRQDDY